MQTIQTTKPREHSAENAEPRPKSQSKPEIYTAFCQKNNGQGTIWIRSIEAHSLSGAKEQARHACANDWDYHPNSIHVLGIAKGDISILDWEDLNA